MYLFKNVEWTRLVLVYEKLEFEISTVGTDMKNGLIQCTWQRLLDIIV